MNRLIKAGTVYPGFVYPKAFLKVVALNLVDLDIWRILDDDQALFGLEGMQKRYPQRQLVPFARREDNDDVACFEVGEGGKVHIIHDYASEGWEQRKTFPDFFSWFESAVKEMIAFEREEEECGLL